MSLLLEALKKAEAAKRTAAGDGHRPAPAPAEAALSALSLAPVNAPIPVLDERPASSLSPPDFSAFTLELAPADSLPPAPPPASSLSPADQALTDASPLPSLELSLPEPALMVTAPETEPGAPMPSLPSPAADYSDELPPPATPPVRLHESLETGAAIEPAPMIAPPPQPDIPAPTITAPAPAPADTPMPPPEPRQAAAAASPALAQKLLQAGHAGKQSKPSWQRHPKVALYGGLGLLLLAVAGWLGWQMLEPTPEPPPRPVAAVTPPPAAPTAEPAADPLAELNDEAEPAPPAAAPPAAAKHGDRAAEQDAPLFRSRVGRDGSRIIVAAQDELGATFAAGNALPPAPPPARPNPAATEAERAMQFSRSHNWTQAQEHWFAAAQLAPANADYAFNLAISLDHLGAGSEAARHYRQAAALAAGGRAGFDPARALARADELEAGQ